MECLGSGTGSKSSAGAVKRKVPGTTTYLRIAVRGAVLGLGSPKEMQGARLVTEQGLSQSRACQRAKPFTELGG